MRVYKDIPYAGDGERLIDLYLPEGECSALLLFFHGGGLESGSRDIAFMPSFAEDMTSAGFGVASAEYRMYPTAKYPDFIEDAALAVSFVKSGLDKYCAYGKLIVGGTSAGGYISQMLCFDASWLGRYGIKPTDIDGFIHDAGQPTAHFNVLKERGIDSRRVIVDESAPLYHVGEAECYPPMQIIVSDNDMESRLEQTELLLSTLRHFGYDMDKVCFTLTSGTHTWYIMRADEDGHSEFANIIIPFIRSII
ncbi:MAG: alpha/beta hydrolase [Clostridia bacterium]|nr:alpha/beta hydrolase [Clostridia bacterium]